MTGFIDAPMSRAPEGATCEMIEAPDGAQLRASFIPAEESRGVFAVVTGWAEFIEKYFEVAEDLRARGFSAAILDWRGQGLSDQVREWDGYLDRLTEDLRLFIEDFARPRGGGPAYLLSHSMGGLPALKLLGGGYDGVERAVLSAPLTRLFPEPMDAIAGAAAGLACSLGAANAPARVGRDDSDAFEGNMYTSDKTRHERFRQLKLAEPRAAQNAPTFGWVRAVRRASREIHQPSYFDPMTVPTLIISAGAERRIDKDDQAAIAARSPTIRHATVPDALHEMLMERDALRAAFWREFDAFLSS